MLPHRFYSHLCDTGGVCTHISYQTDRTFLAQLDTFIKFLGYAHGMFGCNTHYPGSFLLQS